MNLPDISGIISNILQLPSIASVDPSVLRGIFVLAFAFLILVVLGLSRRFFISSSLRSMWSGMMVGIIITVFLEASGFWFYKTYIVGEKFASLPQNLQIVFGDSRQNVEQVLGVETSAKVPSAQSVVSDYQVLPELDAQLVRGTICKTSQTSESYNREKEKR